MLAIGAISLATTPFLPELVQQDFDYTATWVVSPRDVVTMAMTFITRQMRTKIQPKYLIVAGASIIALSMHSPTAIHGDLGSGTSPTRMCFWASACH